MTQVERLYRRLRSIDNGGIVGENAAQALRAAKTILRFRNLEDEGLVRLRVEFDDDPDVSWMDERERKEWNGECYGTITEVLCPCCGRFEYADSVWGHIGYRDAGDPFENPYVVDEMAAALDLYDRLYSASGV